jgi:hypothetical protein
VELRGVGELLVANAHFEGSVSRKRNGYTNPVAQGAILLGDFNVKWEISMWPPWKDAWRELNPPSGAADGADGFTFDQRLNKSQWLLNTPGGSARERLDRVLFTLPGWRPASARLVGVDPIEGLLVPVHTGKTARSMKLSPVWVSDHYGLHVVFERC